MSSLCANWIGWLCVNSAGNKTANTTKLSVDLGIPFLPALQRASSDRNRTSTFAFTGNKFEFRAVGSSQNPSRSNTFLNTILAGACCRCFAALHLSSQFSARADSIEYLSDEIAKVIKSGRSKDQAIESVARATLKQHVRVVFNGNGYSEEWLAEATKRGLPNLRNTPMAMATFLSEKNIRLFEKTKVLSKAELEARNNVWLEEYCKKLVIEGKVRRLVVIALFISSCLHRSLRTDADQPDPE